MTLPAVTLLFRRDWYIARVILPLPSPTMKPIPKRILWEHSVDVQASVKAEWWER